MIMKFNFMQIFVKSYLFLKDKFNLNRIVRQMSKAHSYTDKENYILILFHKRKKNDHLILK